jgi:hypothetical protein
MQPPVHSKNNGIDTRIRQAATGKNTNNGTNDT